MRFCSQCSQPIGENGVCASGHAALQVAAVPPTPAPPATQSVAQPVAAPPHLQGQPQEPQTYAVPTGNSVWSDFGELFKRTFSRRIASAPEFAQTTGRPGFTITASAYALAYTLMTLAMPLRYRYLTGGDLVKALLVGILTAAVTFYGLAGMLAVLRTVTKRPLPFRAIQNTVGAILLLPTLALTGLFLLILVLGPWTASAVSTLLVSVSLIPAAVMVWLQVDPRVPGVRKPIWAFLLGGLITWVAVALLLSVINTALDYSPLDGLVGNYLNDSSYW